MDINSELISLPIACRQGGLNRGVLSIAREKQRGYFSIGAKV